MTLIRPVAVPLLLIALWYLAQKAGLMSSALLPSPEAVFGGAAARVLAEPEFYWSVVSSLRRIFIGWSLAVVIGVSIGLLTSLSRAAKLILDWPMAACRPLPPAALVPLAILWLGIGDGAAITLVTFVAVWPVIINTTAAIDDAPKVLREVALTMGATSRQLVTTVLIPAALPGIVLGLRIAMGLAWMSVVLSELVGVQQGIGALLLSYQQNDDVPALLLVVCFIGVFGLWLDWLFRAAVRPLTRAHKGVLLT